MPHWFADRPPIRRPLTRRRLLRSAGQAIATLPLLGLAPTLRPAAAAPPAQIRAGEWSAAEALSAFDAGGAGEFAAPFPFTALGAHWATDSPDDLQAHLTVSTSRDGADWSPWRTLHGEEHGPGPAGRTDRHFTTLHHVEPSRLVRFRATGPDGAARPLPPDLRFVYIDASDGPAAPDLDGQINAFAATLPRVVTRAGWGCDEKLRFDKDGKEIWKPEYRTTEKIILHHTETPNERDPLEAVRAIYYHHTVVMGWGDLGYNFLVDRNGVVYEGRHGGEGVVGGHTLRYNLGSVGIAVVGSFTDAPIPPAAEAAIVQLAAYKGRFLNPQASYYFVDKALPSVVGHRDCLNTACPGDACYPRLPAIREGVAAIIGTDQRMDVAITGISAGGGSAIVSTPYLVKVTVKNTGTAVLPSYYDAGLTYREGDTFDSKGATKVTGRFRVTAELDGIHQPATNPYRWGFGRSLNPGETAEIACRIAFDTMGAKKLRLGLVQENIGYRLRGLDGPALTVIPNPVTPVGPPADAASDVAFFPETGHTLRGALRRYWERFGGLAQFGYPLTEEFPEVSEADGKEYTVQYFERARFELHPEHAGTDYEVLLGQLGRHYHAGDDPAPPLATPGTVYVPETGHNLGGPFKAHWEEHGGLFVYGFPITEEFVERSRVDGKEYTVQYFERARFELHPENSGTSQILLGLLGRQVLQDRGWIK